MKIIAIDRTGKEVGIEAEEGLSVMEHLRDDGLAVAAICGGNCSCATCHVYVDAVWFDRLESPREDELELVSDSANYRAGESRLSCQIEFKSDLDGLRVALAPED